jgi:DNA repair photolyase
VTVTRALVDAGAPHERHHTLTPYVGCLVGCRFCYAQGRVGESRRMAGLPDVGWGSFVDARTNLPEVLERELESAPAWPLKFCPIVSDPYQAIERRLQLTRRCLEVLARAHTPRPVLVLTRTALVERDLDLIASLPGARVGVSLPTIDDEVRRHFEPRGASIAERLRVLERFRDAGVETFAVVQPQLPGDVDALADALARTVRSVSLDVLRDAFAAEDDFAPPAYQAARTAPWQAERAAAVARALEVRGVPCWTSELPPSLVRAA